MPGPGGLGRLLGPLILGGLGAFWGLFNFRKRPAGGPTGDGDISFSQPAPISVSWRTLAWSEQLLSCVNDQVIGSQSAPSNPLPTVSAVGTRVRWSVAAMPSGVVCEPWAATAGRTMFVEILNAQGEVVKRESAFFGGREASGYISYSSPSRTVGAVLTALSYAGQAQDLGTGERDPSDPIPAVPLPPAPGVLPPLPPQRRPDPSLPPVPAPQPQPEPDPSPQPQPGPQRDPASVPSTPPTRPLAPPFAPPWTQPGTAPAPIPGTTPGTAPGQAPAPRPGQVPQPGPVPFPSQDPTRPTRPTAPDGSVVPTPTTRPPTTPGRDVVVGAPDRPIRVVPRQVPPTLEGIALETGRIERKLETLLGDPSGGQPDWLEKAQTGGNAAARILELLFSLTGGTTYTLSSPCEVDEQGDPLPPVEVQAGSALNTLGLIINRIDALAELLQVHKNLKQPSCKNPRPQGEPVTVNFEQI